MSSSASAAEYGSGVYCQTIQIYNVGKKAEHATSLASELPITESLACEETRECMQIGEVEPQRSLRSPD